jgi:hypothetical protein
VPWGWLDLDRQLAGELARQRRQLLGRDDPRPPNRRALLHGGPGNLAAQRAKVRLGHVAQIVHVELVLQDLDIPFRGHELQRFADPLNLAGIYDLGRVDAVPNLAIGSADDVLWDHAIAERRDRDRQHQNHHEKRKQNSRLQGDGQKDSISSRRWPH